MTTKKKSAPKATGEKSKKATAAKAPAKALTEPAAVATRATMKADKVEVKAEPKPEIKAEGPVSPTVAAKAAAQTASHAEKVVAQAVEAPEPEVKAEIKAEAKAIEVTTSTEKPVLTIGMFQKRLHERGYYHGWWDGQYGPMTKHAVARFQADHGLHPDGEPTPATLTALGL